MRHMEVSRFMKLKQLLMIQGVTALCLLVSPVVSLATGTEESSVAAEGEVISQEIEDLVSVINKKYKALNEIDTTIAKSKETIKTARKDIVQTEEHIAKRSDYVAKQMQVLQLRGTTKPTILALLDSKSVSDFFNRAYAISVLSFAQKDKVESLHQDKEKLVKLQEKLEDNQKGLKEQQEVASVEKEELDSRMSGLKDKLANNKDLLEKLVSERIEKEKTRKEALVKAEKSKKKGSKAAEPKVLATVENKLSEKSEDSESPQNDSETTESTSANSETETSEEVTETTEPEGTTGTEPKEPKPEEKPSTGGMSGQATAYIATGNKTATGTVPQVGRTIAVDPGLIPLGSAVQITVPGAPSYSGVYIAEDTGGVVKGAIIDIFVGSQGEAVSFGRQSITFTIL